MIDQEMSLSKAWAIIEWAGGNLDDYVTQYYVPEGDNMVRPTFFFRPAYFRTMLVRLYSFNGEAIPAARTLVIELSTKKVDINGQATDIRVTTETLQFDSYADAQAYIAERPGKDLEIVSDTPLQSPLPMPALDSFRQVYRSPTGTNPVAIFQLLD